MTAVGLRDTDTGLCALIELLIAQHKQQGES
jgi:hypothetical protein